MHLDPGFSLRETAVRALVANLADMSDVALLKCFRKCKDWLAALCHSMFEERGINLKNHEGLGMRLLDATTLHS